MMTEIDHFVWGVSDLEAGCAEIERLFGASPQRGGAHPGLGTCNALLSLGSGTYLEIMAPQDPPPASVGERLAQLDAPGLVTWVLRSGDLSQIVGRVADRCTDIASLGPTKTERLTPEGERLSWELLFLTQHKYGGLVPFFIDWQDTPHPSATSPAGGAATALTIASPQAERLNQLFADLAIDMTASAAAEAALSVQFETRAGRVALTSTPQSLSVLGF
ncbi:MAG: VOC family protein [Henriciella sp.]|nr:VOC family protein [Henriciella sp.]